MAKKNQKVDLSKEEMEQLMNLANEHNFLESMKNMAEAQMGIKMDVKSIKHAINGNPELGTKGINQHIEVINDNIEDIHKILNTKADKSDVEEIKKKSFFGNLPEKETVKYGAVLAGSLLSFGMIFPDMAKSIKAWILKLFS